MTQYARRKKNISLIRDISHFKIFLKYEMVNDKLEETESIFNKEKKTILYVQRLL